jgi:cyclic pyranopterin phosphate synthase
MPKEGLSQLGHDDILRYEEILRIVKAATGLGIVKIRITGGEPLVRRGVLDFLKALNSMEALQEVTLTTNGILLEKMAADLWDTGVRRINISLDSLKPERYAEITRGGDLRKVLNGIKKAHEEGFSPLKINIVVMKGFNDDEILDFADLTKNEPYQIRFIELMSIGKTVFQDYAFVSNKAVMEKIESRYKIIPVANRSKSDGPAVVYKIDGAPGEIGFIGSGSRHICRTCNRMRLTAEGHLRACLLSDHEIDIKKALRSGCSNDELEIILREAIKGKSEDREHKTEEKTIKKCVKPMSAIGG